MKYGGVGFIHNPPTGELIFCLIQTCVYFPHAHALMRDGNMIEVSIIHTHSPSTYFQPYVLLCCSVSHYCPQIFFFFSCSGEGAVSNSPEEKQRMCFKVYFDVNNTNLCFRTTTSYDGREGPALQNIQLVRMNLCAKQDFDKNHFFLFSAKAT